MWCVHIRRGFENMRIWKKTIKIELSPKAYDLIKCSHCGSERLDEIGDEVLECMDCKAVKALS